MSSNYTEEIALRDLVEILEDITADWDMAFEDDIGRDTRLIEDLGFESIDVVQYIAAVEKHYGRRGMPFEELVMADGRYVDEITVEDSVRFLMRHLNPQ